jgi:hypothetical protein
VLVQALQQADELPTSVSGLDIGDDFTGVQGMANSSSLGVKGVC